MDTRRMKSFLTSEQQRQFSEMKKKDEQELELERQVKRSEKKDDGDTKSIEEKGTSPFSRPSSATLVKSSPVIHHRLLSNSSKLSEELHLPINTSAVLEHAGSQGECSSLPPSKTLPQLGSSHQKRKIIPNVGPRKRKPEVAKVLEEEKVADSLPRSNKPDLKSKSRQFTRGISMLSLGIPNYYKLPEPTFYSTADLDSNMTCETCGVMFQKMNDFITHLNFNVDCKNALSHTCSKCGKEFKTRTVYEKHLDSHVE